jgi:hypothetical protein
LVVILYYVRDGLVVILYYFRDGLVVIMTTNPSLK